MVNGHPAPRIPKRTPRSWLTDRHKLFPAPRAPYSCIHHPGVAAEGWEICSDRKQNSQELFVCSWFCSCHHMAQPGKRMRLFQLIIVIKKQKLGQLRRIQEEKRKKKSGVGGWSMLIFFHLTTHQEYL